MFGQFGFEPPGVAELEGGAVVDGDALVDGEAVLDGEAPMSGETLGDGDAAAWAITSVPNPPAKPTPTASTTFATEPRKRTFMADHLHLDHWRTSLSIRLPFDERILIKVVKLTPGQGS
jgi:hypothetical protein